MPALWSAAPIGIIDFYGLNRLSQAEARQALTFKEGDLISFGDGQRAPFLAESERRCRVCPACRRRERTSSVAIGVARLSTSASWRMARPSCIFERRRQGHHASPPDVAAADDEFSAALVAAVQRGDTEEDRSQGHALNHDPRMRVVQERFIEYAERDLPLLRRVLRESSDPTHRALAAQVLGYAADKQSVVDDLVDALGDPFDEVRNNAMRTLLVFAEAAPSPSQRVPRVPYQPFIGLLNSPVWSDRNKASLALMALSEKRDPALLALLRRDALASLIEMARWKNAGHAQAAFIIVGRIAGYSDAAAQAAWDRGARDAVISAALNRR